MRRNKCIAILLILVFCFVAGTASARQEKRPSKPVQVDDSVPVVSDSTTQEESKPVKKSKQSFKKRPVVSPQPVAENSGDTENNKDSEGVSTDVVMPVATEDSTNQQPVQPVETKLEDSVISATLPPSSFPDKTDFIKEQDEKQEDKVNTTGSVKAGNISNQVDNESLSQPPAYPNMILSTFMIIFAIVVLALVWKYLQSKNFRLGDASGKLKLIAQHPISIKSKLMIVEAMGKKFLIGATQDRIQLLSDLEYDGTGAVSIKDEYHGKMEMPVKDNEDTIKSGFIESLRSVSAEMNRHTAAPPKSKPTFFMSVDDAMIQDDKTSEAKNDVASAQMTAAQRIRMGLKNRKKVGGGNRS